MEDIIDLGDEIQNTEVPQIVKTLGILAIIGSSLWGLLLVIGMAYILSAAGGAMAIPGFGNAMGIVVGIFVFLILLNVLALVGAVKMMNGSKGAFILYAVANGIWGLLMLLGSGNSQTPAVSILAGLASIGFIIAFGVQMKNMPNK